MSRARAGLEPDTFVVIPSGPFPITRRAVCDECGQPIPVGCKGRYLAHPRFPEDKRLWCIGCADGTAA